MMEHLITQQSIIITLDVDAFLLDKLKHIEETELTVVEINSITPELLRHALHDFPTLRIGVGNVLDVCQLEQAYQAGAHFITSPGFIPSIAQTASIYSMNYLPGIATLSEAMAAMELGCKHVRPYPANLGFCGLLNKSLPLLRLYPADVEWEEIEHFLMLPSVAAISLLNPDSQRLSLLVSNIPA